MGRKYTDIKRKERKDNERQRKKGNARKEIVSTENLKKIYVMKLNVRFEDIQKENVKK